MKKSKNSWTTWLLILIMIAGVSLLLYPSVSNYWNSFRQSQVISEYAEQVAGLAEESYAEVWEAAWNYNRDLWENKTVFGLTEEQKTEYEELLDISGLGVMGMIEIPKIDCLLPIYHGTEEAVLQTAVGHLEWSSLPVGGENSHCVLSGHRGLPSAKLFTELDKLVEGDLFFLRVLDEVLTYEVDQILIVEPQEVSDLKIEEGKDLCTLVTCTPYGINTHRLLVRGHRIENVEEAENVRITADAMQVEPLLAAAFMGAGILLILLLWLLFPKRSKKGKGEFYEDK